MTIHELGKSVLKQPVFQGTPFRVSQLTMEVCLLSGEVLTVLDSEEVQGKTALAVKQALVPKVGVTGWIALWKLCIATGKPQFLVSDSSMNGSLQAEALGCCQ